MKKDDCDCEFGTMCPPKCLRKANERARAARLKRRLTNGIWPKLHSEALACHPDDVKEFEKDAAKKGVPTKFDSEGRPVFTDRIHYNKYLRAYGKFNKDAGYSDAVPLVSAPDTSRLDKLRAKMKQLGITANNTGDVRELLGKTMERRLQHIRERIAR